MKIASSMLVMAGLVCLLSTGCGMKVMTKGRVVDAVSGKPVEGAAVAIYWVHEKFKLPGLGSNDEDIGTTETLTDAQGSFTIPRYLNRTPFMGVYKKGYVCWSSEINFNPLGKTYEETFQKCNINIQNGMVIQLKLMPANVSSEQSERHACFVVDVDTRLWTSDVFDKSIKHEDDLCTQFLRRNKNEK